MSEKFLDKAYHLDGTQETRDLYDKWAASYEAEVAENGYATPGRVADALWVQLPDPRIPVLDFGCGTGLSGLALRRAGFEIVDGMDPSDEMLDGARGKSVYRNLITLNLGDVQPIEPGAYQAMTAIGVIGTGAAPPETFDILMKALPRGGMLAFSFNDHTLADAAFTSRLSDWVDSGAGILLSKDYGDHLPGLNMKSEVYVIRKS